MATYRVHGIPANGRTTRMCRGLGDNLTEWDEPRFAAQVIDQQGRVVATLHNGSVLCLPGRCVQAPQASDEEILRAVLGDESVV